MTLAASTFGRPLWYELMSNDMKAAEAIDPQGAAFGLHIRNV
jgi:hypothetical protein